MTSQTVDLMRRFRDRLETAEKKSISGNRAWQISCLEHALELLEEDPDAASKWLDEFDKLPSRTESAEAHAKLGPLSIEDIRMRFDNLGGGIV